MSLHSGICTTGMLLLASVICADGAYGQTSFVATFDSSPSSACRVLAGGCRNFTAVLGGVSFDFAATTAGDGAIMMWEDRNGYQNSASIAGHSFASNPGTLETISIKRQDNQLFNFTGVFVNNALGAFVQVTPHREGKLAGPKQTVPGSAHTMWFGGITVDEVRISGNGLSRVNFDSFMGTIPPVNASPVISLDGSTTGAMEQVPTAVDHQLTVLDSDSSMLEWATVAISGNRQPGEDVLGFTNDGSTMGNIVGSYNAGTGVLTLSSSGSSSTVAQWQAALRSVTYTNISDTPNSSDRTFTFMVSDGATNSVAANKTLEMISVNDTPVLTSPVVINIQRGQPTAVTGISAADADSGSGQVSIALSVGSGTFSGSSSGGITVAGSGTENVLISGTVAILNAYIAGQNLSYTSVSNPQPGLEFLVTLNDDGNTGSGGAQAVTETIAVTVGPPASVSEWGAYGF